MTVHCSITCFSILIVLRHLVILEQLFLEMVFKCITCCVQFDNIEDYRAHFQSEWHCYNLKRKVAGLPPVTKIDFEERKALAEQKQKDNTKIKGKKPKKEKKSKKNHKNVNKGWLNSLILLFWHINKY